jgi:hypothetical protein
MARHRHTYVYSRVGGAYPGIDGGVQTGTSIARVADYQNDTEYIGSGSNTYPDNIAMQMYIKY